MSPGFEALDQEDRELLRVAVRAARRAARVHRQRSPAADGRDWQEKSRSDFVTEVDLEAQDAVVETIQAAFPAHRIVAEEEEVEEEEKKEGEEEGEEEDGVGGAGVGDGGKAGKAPAAEADEAKGAAAGGGHRGGAKAARPTGPARREERDAGNGSAGAPGGSGGSSLRWIVDPLDGTTNWLHGYPEYAASVAVEDHRGLRVGVVLNSASGERFEAVRGSGSRRFPAASGAGGGGDPVPARVSAISRLELALVGTGFPFKKLEFMDPYLEVFGRVLGRTSGIRRAGSAALDLCHLACGRLDAFWEMWLMPWDVAAGALVLREAGGLLESLPLPGEGPGGDSGGSLPESFAHRRPAGYLGANPALMPGFRALVRSHRRGPEAGGTGSAPGEAGQHP